MICAYCSARFDSLLGTRHGLVEQVTSIYFVREKTIAMKVLGS